MRDGIRAVFTLLSKLRPRINSLLLWVSAWVISVSGMASFVWTERVHAAQLTSRKVTISTSKASATGVSYQYDFTIPTATAIQGMIFEYCTNPLGTCTKPTGMDINHTTAAVGAQTFSEATTFAEYTGADLGACDNHDTGSSSTEYCVTRTDPDAETATAKSFTITSITNPSTTSVDDLYIRIRIFSDTSFATEVHNGVVAAAIVQQLTVNGRVAERLEFCVAAIDDDDPLFANCAAAPATTTIDIGIINNSTISRSPVDDDGSNGANDHYGVAMVNTNAGNGVVVTFFAEPDTGGTNQLRTFRVDDATCSSDDTITTDPCFRPAAETGGGTLFVAGDERFGMHIPCIDTTQGTTSNLVGDTDFDNDDGDTSHSINCESTEGGNTFGWNVSSTATPIATSAGSSVKVVDDEVIKMRFGATASPTTPAGSYTVVSTYIATPTF